MGWWLWYWKVFLNVLLLPSTLSLLWDHAPQHGLSGTVPQCLTAWDGGWHGPLLFCSSLGPSDPGCLSLVWEASSETLHLLFMPIALNGVFASLVLKSFVPPPKNRRPLMLFVQELRPQMVSCPSPGMKCFLLLYFLPEMQWVVSCAIKVTGLLLLP